MTDMTRDNNFNTNLRIVDWAHTVPFINRYQSHPKRLVENGETIKAFTFPVHEIQDILNQEGNPDHLTFILGRHEEDGVGPNKGFTLIAIGSSKEGGQLILQKEDEKHHIIDYCEPCPSICPSGI